jgi:hypothetical protein
MFPSWVSNSGGTWLHLQERIAVFSCINVSDVPSQGGPNFFYQLHAHSPEETD